MNEKIGKVTLNLDYYEGQDFYSDGVIEEHLLELVKHHEPEEYQDIILKEKKLGCDVSSFTAKREYFRVVSDNKGRFRA